MFRTVSALQNHIRRRALAVASSTAPTVTSSSPFTTTATGPVSSLSSLRQQQGARSKPLLVAFKSTAAKLEYDVVNDDASDHSSTTSTVDKKAPSVSSLPSSSAPSASSSSSSIADDDKEPTAATSYSSFDRTKLGTPSPWAVFDAWGAGADENVMDITDPLSNDERRMLTSESVKIPLNETDRTDLPPETDILKAYDHLLRGKSSVHFGYPYNLMFDFTELSQFLKYSINNLGDPFVPSNYGVHSRQFECSVIDFFANLWKMPPNDYWGYGACNDAAGVPKEMCLRLQQHVRLCSHTRSC
jgi:hypothetical protein